VIDLHCHVLPGLDDGPAELEDSLEMLEALAAEGVSTVVATPHVGGEHPDVVPGEIELRCAELEAAGCGVAVEPGGQLSLQWLLDASPADVRRASLGSNGNDLLVNVPHGRLPERFDDDLRDVMAAGYRVVLAHPEVSSDFQRRPERLVQLVAAGALVQVTARALTRGGGQTPSAALARDLVSSELCHVLASDAHSAGPWRAPDLRRGVLEAARLSGARAEWMVNDAPAAILAGAPLPRPPEGAATARGLAYLRRHAAV
jgi:protein-tyrosine phosphatase